MRAARNTGAHTPLGRVAAADARHLAVPDPLHDRTAMYIHAYGLAFLELTFLLVTVMLLHNLKPALGSTAFYLALATTLGFAQLITAAGLRIANLYPGLDIAIGPAIFFTPLVVALLITYVVEGTLEAQRLIVGIMAVAGIALYLSFISERQALVPGYQLAPSMPSGIIVDLLQSGRRFLLAALLSMLIQFLILPIIYQLLRNHFSSLALSVFGALLLTQVLDAFFYELVTNQDAADWWTALRHSCLARSAATLWGAALTTFYLRQHAAAAETDDARGPLDIINALFGTYGQARRLQASVREWEGRYRMVVNNTSDLILLVDRSGLVLDANTRFLRRSGRTLGELARLSLDELMEPADGVPVRWVKLWDGLYPSRQRNENRPRTEATTLGGDWRMHGADGSEIILDISLSPITLRNNRAILVAARDITRRHELEIEREQLREKFVQLERMDAVGKLAGGIAHDFNNLLHAIRGSLDMLEPHVPEEPAHRLLTNIATATERASTLTGQLLAFARGGKYSVSTIDLEHLVRQTEALFRPLLRKGVTLKLALHPDPMQVEGDFTQLQQVLLNLLINAHAALADEGGRIVLRAEPASPLTPGWDRADHDRDDSRRYVVLRVRDNGAGIPQETLRHIFEPFFTTKEDGGTGMGLAMAYGCIENHHGWLHVATEQDKGTEFYVFLPCPADTETQDHD
jgi:PAS domain S-box-containing protein